jgi:aspartyl-tRNA(Asn)/glutamyl-tRNA(Gln) amidotransferase subunit B
VGGATGRIHGATHSLVDYNRAGIPLVEVVTKPVPGTGALAPAVARAYVTELREICRTLEVSDVRMEQGSLRCDVNVSLNLPGAGWGTRTETKNVNSLRSVERAVRSEIIRQAGVLSDGGRIVQETRHFHEDTGQTTSGRSKEEATDYRYFPEPDLVPVAPDPAWVESIRAAIPELPAARRERLVRELNASEHDMQAMANAGVIELVVAAMAAGAPAADARKWWLGYLSQQANAAEQDPADLRITPAQLASVIALIAAGTLSDGLARQVIDVVLETGQDPADVVTERNIRTVSDTSALTAAVDEAIAAQPAIVEKIRGGKIQAAGPLVGAVMKATRGQADAGTVRSLILDRLGVTE